MSATETGANRRWLWSTAGGLLIAAIVGLLFSLSVTQPPIQTPKAATPRPAIELAERHEKSALDDEATLLDPTPLFQPTHWSTAQLQVERPEPSGSFQSYPIPPKFGFADNDLKLGRAEAPDSTSRASAQPKLRASLDLPEPVRVPATVSEALIGGSPGAVALGFGRTGEPVEALPSRGALVDIVAMGTGRAALPPQAMAQIQSLAAGAKPPSGREWHAMEFLAAVAPAGLASPLTLTVRSDVDDVDAYFQNFLVKTLHVGERLAPGFYRISVGP